MVESLNAVPAQLLSLTYQSQLPHLHWTRGYWVRFFFWEYQLMVFSFWWWVGWKFDLQAEGHDWGRAGTIAEAVAGIVLSIVLFEHRTVLRVYPYRDAEQWVVVGWSILLSGYFLMRLARLWITSRQPAR
jgi:hypothetical protein